MESRLYDTKAEAIKNGKKNFKKEFLVCEYPRKKGPSEFSFKDAGKNKGAIEHWVNVGSKETRNKWLKFEA